MSYYSDITKTRVVHNYGKNKVLYHTVIKQDSQAVHHEEHEMEFIKKHKRVNKNTNHWSQYLLKKGVSNSCCAGPTSALKENG